MKKKRKKLKIFLITSLILIAGLIAGFLIYTGDYYKSGERAQKALESSDKVTVQYVNGNIIFEPANIETHSGMIFYPGGKVEYNAYAPLMESLAEKGVFCVLVKMPFNLAVFDMNAADGIKNTFPQITEWSIGGHSLGGAMAATYAGKHTDEYKNLILLAAYSTTNLKDSGINVISLYGSKDGVLNMNKYDKYEKNLPDNYYKDVINGGCHSGFGDYGAQSGDNEPEISGEQQISETVKYIMSQLK